MAVRLLSLPVFFLMAASTARATDYYVSALGDDANAGTSPADAWLTVQRVNNGQYNPGDRILFEGGKTFGGNLYLDGSDAGTPDAPITIGSYGIGRATIYAGDGTGILIYNAAGYIIRDLYIVGSGSTTNLGEGIFFFTDLPGDVKLPCVRIDHVDAVRFGDYGILIGADNANTGYRDVRITYTIASDNQMGGIFTYAQNVNVHENVYIGNSSAFNNSGKRGLLFNSGNGLTLSSVNGAVIERSVARDNGYLSDAGNGPVGIWAFNSTRVTLQFNESYRNLTGGEKDGGGFGFDLNTSDSVMQYNYSHDNQGAGYQLAHKPDTFVHRNNVIRYNVSENDGRAHDYAAIQTWGRILDAEIYNNTIYISPQPAGAVGVPRAILIKNSSITLQDPQRLHFRNNIIQTTGSVRLIEAQASALDGAADLRFEGNNYHTTGGTFRIVWGGITYTSLAAWRAAGQERLNGRDVGLNVDPELLAPNGHVSFNNARMLPGLYGYRLGASSLLIDAGVDLRTLGIDPGPRDYFGGDLPFNGAYDIGAHEYRASCNWAITPASASSPETAGTATIDVTAADGSCGWAARSTVNWMGISGGEVGSGAGSVSYFVLANSTSTARTGSISIADRTFALTQAAGAGGGGGGGGGTSGEIVLYAATAPVIAGAWSVVADSTAAGGSRLQNPNAGAAKILAPLASPASYFELTFSAAANTPYHVWIRGTATANSYANDSVHVQFDTSVDASGAAVYRIGTTSSTEVNIEDCSGCGLSGWGWQDNAYGTGVEGSNIYFAASGTQRIRVQVREDGLGIDQIVLSPATYLTASPGALKNDATILSASGSAAESGGGGGGGGGGTPSAEVVLYAAEAVLVQGAWSRVNDSTAATGVYLQNPNAGAAKLTSALAQPVHFFELTFDAEAGRPYHLWLRGKATSNSYSNDSVHAQFSDSIDAAGIPIARIGTTQSAEINLEDCSGCGVAGWGWQDNGYAGAGADIYFSATGRHTIRVQVREDGLGIDQIVVSPAKYLTTSPGLLKNDGTIVPR
jgi:Right handed beta helix region